MWDENLKGRKGNILRIQQKEYERAREIKRHPGIAAEHKSEKKEPEKATGIKGKRLKVWVNPKLIQNIFLSNQKMLRSE